MLSAILEIQDGKFGKQDEEGYCAEDDSPDDAPPILSLLHLLCVSGLP
jgi:hypothetical protein